MVFSLKNAFVGGTLTTQRDTELRGDVDFHSLQLSSLSDHPDSWDTPGCLLRLNGFVYNAFTGAGVSARERIEWLERQESVAKEWEFLPQPYEQCAKVLREMGHQDDAREVLVKKERRLRAARRNRESETMAIAMGLRDWFLGWSICYGQKPLRAAWYLLALWLIGTVAFFGAYGAGAFKPNNAFVLRADEWVNCGQQAKLWSHRTPWRSTIGGL